MLPPIQVLYFLSGGANILILISFSANLCNSCSSRSPNPFVRVEPPESTILPKSDFLRSRSVFWMAWTTTSWIPGYSDPMSSGSKSSSGALQRSAPIYIPVSISHLSKRNILLQPDRPSASSHRAKYTQRSSPPSHQSGSTPSLPS